MTKKKKKGTFFQYRIGLRKKSVIITGVQPGRKKMRIKGNDGYSFSEFETDRSPLAVHSENYYEMDGGYPLWFGWSLHSICRNGWYFKHSNTTINSIEIPFSGCLQIIRNNNVHNLTPGMAMILPEGEENRLTTQDASLDKFAFGLKGSLAAPLIYSLFGDNLLISGIDPMAIQTFYNRISPLIKSGKRQNIPAMNGIGLELLFYLASHVNKMMPAELSKAVQILNYNSGRKIKISDVARECNFSSYQLNRLFFKYYNMSPKQYLMQQKLLKACALLKETGKQIKEIAADIGYSDMHIFSREFKKRYNVTPQKYRNHVVSTGKQRHR